MSPLPSTGTVHQLSVSAGGVPKLPVPACVIGPSGLERDRQRQLQVHGGPERAVCLLGLDVIDALRAVGHPIGPGTTGENMTLAGLVWADVRLGTRFVFAGGVVLVATSFARPCPAIRASMLDGDIRQLDARVAPGRARVYARVETSGRVAAGEAVTLHPARTATDAGLPESLDGPRESI